MSNYWVSVGSGVYKASADYIDTPLTYNTYEANSSFFNNESTISFGDGEGWKTSVVANRRAFIANITRDGRIYGDRIYYSPTNRFDTFPSYNYIDIGINDGDEIIKLSFFGDRLFAFKKNTLYIINISQANDTAWFLEESYTGYGVHYPYAVFRSKVGIAWANKNGAFLFDGNTINDITKDKIDVTQWDTTYQMSNSIVGYYPKANFLYFSNIPPIEKHAEKVTFVYDLKTGSWAIDVGEVLTYYYGDAESASLNAVVTNYDTDHFGNCINFYSISYNALGMSPSPPPPREYDDNDTGVVVR